MNTIDLFTPDSSHAPELGRICFEAFRQISTAHGFEMDFPDAPIAAQVIRLVQSLPASFQVAARLDGHLAGSNFMILTDSVAGVGPISVAPALQGHGIGRRLMQAALDYAALHGYQQIRLLQDSYNTTSLSLYTSLGFDVREPAGLLTPPPPGQRDNCVRKAQAGDLSALKELGERIYKTSRRNELATWMERGFAVLVHETQGRIRGYLAPGRTGHGVAETEAVALALISQISHHAPPGMGQFFCPLRNGSFYRGLLKGGCRLTKVMNLMTLGPYEAPEGVWMPSIAF